MPNPLGQVRTVVITGAAGFLGSHLTDAFIERRGWRIVGIDSFAHAGDSKRFSAEALSSGRLQIHSCDLSTPLSRTLIRQIGSVDAIINLASLSNVDYSLREPRLTVNNNVGISLTMLEYAREIHPQVLVQVSTDEVYGPAESGVDFSEWSPIRPSNPYAASKAAQESIALAYWRSYGVPLVIVNSTNVFGPRQSVEKYIPQLVSLISRNLRVSIHARHGVPGTRIYLAVRDWVDAVLYVLDACTTNGMPSGSSAALPPRFNVAGGLEVDNLDLARQVAGLVTHDLDFELVEGDTFRPGHDVRYGLDGSRLASLGWRAQESFKDALRDTVAWYLKHPEWL